MPTGLMKAVVDVNFLRDAALEAYLKEDRGNCVVLIDLAAKESYKGPSLENLHRSLEIVSRSPAQVVILKGTRDIVRFQAQGDYSLEDFVDLHQTQNFGRFCQGVETAIRGDNYLEAQLLVLHKEANAQLADIHRDVADLAEAVQDWAAGLSPRQLKELRTNVPLTKDAYGALARNTMLLAATLFRDHPEVSSLPPPAKVRDTLIFRFALAAHLWVLRWISEGGVASVSTATLANDVVDLYYVAYATYYDRMLSKDQKLISIHTETAYVLERLFGPETWT